MANMYDFFRWRGDLNMLQDGFHELDNLILTYFSYVELDQVFARAPKDTLTIREISNSFFEIYSPEDLEKDRSFIKGAPHVMKEMATTSRYGDLLVRNYVNEVNIQQNLQFSAMEILLPDRTSFVAFRGTDDTIIGWKEDFYLSTMLVNAQKMAVEYLNKIGKMDGRILRVGGHSKGGNLAIYAGACCVPEVKEKILAIYCNDGPGFHRDFLESEAYLSVEDRIHRYIPEECIIGMLLHHTKKPMIIQSDAKNIMQHDPLSWQMEGNHFLFVNDVTKASKVAEQSIANWLESIPNEERAPFVEDLFSVFEATGAETLTELYNGGMKSLQAMVKQMNKLSPDTRARVSQLLNGYFSTWGELIKDKGESLKEKHKSKLSIRGKRIHKADLLEDGQFEDYKIDDQEKTTFMQDYRKLKEKMEEKIEETFGDKEGGAQ